MPTTSAATAEVVPVPVPDARPSDVVPDSRASLATTLAVLGAAEAVLAIAHLAFGIGLVPVAILHFGVVGLAFRQLVTEPPSRGDVTARALIICATAAAGPIGVLAGWLFSRASAERPAAASPLLDEWYRRIALSAEIDPVTELCDNVASGRTMNLASPVPQSFLSVMVSGPISDQQTALGLIARRFHPDYLPALTRALRSPEPVIRVQAAAVVARIRDELQERVRGHLAALDGGARPANAAARLAELSKAAESGLLDETDRLRAEALLAGEGSRDAIQRPMARPGATGFKALRIGYRTGRILRRGAYRVRKLRAGHSPKGVVT